MNGKCGTRVGWNKTKKRFKVVLNDGNNDDSNTCRECKTNTYQSQAGKVLCLECAQGQWINETGAEKCNLCEMGRYRKGGLQSSLVCLAFNSSILPHHPYQHFPPTNTSFRI